MARRQAVLLIHGIGEQRPMETLRGFVDTVWCRDTAIHNPHAVKNGGALVWSKPDTVSDSFELRRLTTPENTGRVRTDFFEFYWQHLMQGTTYGHVFAWLWTLLVRRPSTVPTHLQLAYLLLLTLALASLGTALYAGVAAASSTADDRPFVSPWISVSASLLLVPLVGLVVRSILGDAARYLHIAPSNVQCRHAIRRAGVKVLAELHRRGYDRIVVVGHSLGSVIGYDLLTYAFPDYHAAAPAQPPAMQALDALEAMASSSSTAPSGNELQPAQRAYAHELAANGSRWRVTDFVTLGSPLAHAEILLARDRADLQQKQQDRELPTCLPVLETVQRDGQTLRRFTYPPPDAPAPYRIPHHAAVFGPTRWTNLYFANRAIVHGDLVGGPLAAIWGRGVRDVAVTTPKWFGFLAHTHYWTQPRDGSVPDCVRQLRQTIDLTDQRRPNAPKPPADANTEPRR